MNASHLTAAEIAHYARLGMLPGHVVAERLPDIAAEVQRLRGLLREVLALPTAAADIARSGDLYARITAARLPRT